MASAIYPSFKTDILKGDIDLLDDTIKVMLVDGYSYNAAHDRADDITDEVSGSGYTAGGATLGSKTVDGGVFDAADVSWGSSTITADGAVIYKSTGTAANDPLIAYIDFAGDKISSNGSFTIQWHTSGILAIT